MAKTIYVIRHGQTDFNKQGIIQGSGVDSDLNDTGRAQAQAFFDCYQDVPFELIVVSTLKRTHQTAQPFINKGIPTTINANFNEMSWGEHEGKPTNPEMLKIYKAMIAAWEKDDLTAALPGGESAQQLVDRIGKAIDYLKSCEEKTILVCMHGRSMRALMTTILGEHPRKMEQYNHSNTGLFLLEMDDDGKISILKHNNTDHLEPIGS